LFDFINFHVYLIIIIIIIVVVVVVVVILSVCYHCGGKGHLSCTYGTPNHLKKGGKEHRKTICL